jgi:prepilin-type N-terminal cleavage/methylation domain-containing protein
VDSYLTIWERRISRGGFSLVEIVTAVAVLAVLGTIILYVYSPVTANDRQRYATVADGLQNIAWAIARQEPMVSPANAGSFFHKVGVYPGKLSDLTDPITTAEKNICGSSFYTAAQVSAWKPFYFRDLRDGTPLAPGFALQDALVLVRRPHITVPPPTFWGRMAIRFPSVTLADAEGLDLTMDGTVDATSGGITYSSTDPTPVLYALPFSDWPFSGC